jgi:type I restriction enzyme M protein
VAQIGGHLDIEEAKRLILKKLYDIACQELERYLSAEKRALIQGVENLWNKYAVSNQVLEQQRRNSLDELNGFLNGLRYLG